MGLKLVFSQTQLEKYNPLSYSKYRTFIDLNARTLNLTTFLFSITLNYITQDRISDIESGSLSHLNWMEDLCVDSSEYSTSPRFVCLFVLLAPAKVCLLARVSNNQ